MEAPTQICSCVLTEAGKTLQACIRRLEEKDGTKSFQKELERTKQEWEKLFKIHITDYRREFQLQMIQYVKARAINSDLVAGKEALKTGLMTAATIREARKPVTRKQKKEKQPVERKRKK